MTTPLAMLAVNDHMNVVDVVDRADRILRTFRYGADRAMHVADVLTKTLIISVATFDELLEVFKAFSVE